eukprot:COSAG01_NODE_1156_length_11478_cov_3.862642_4_plen_179_part_00
MRRFALLLAAILLSYLSQPAGKYTYVTPKLVTMAARDKQHITVRLFIDLKGVAATCYTIIGISSSPMVLPPAFQVCTQPPPIAPHHQLLLLYRCCPRKAGGLFGIWGGGGEVVRGEREVKRKERGGGLWDTYMTMTSSQLAHHHCDRRSNRTDLISIQSAVSTHLCSRCSAVPSLILG